MSDRDRQDDASAPPEEAPPPTGVPGAPEPATLRRGLFGYKREDVDRALRDRGAQVAELRQDIAALWLAFAQHDRMIRTALGTLEPDAPDADSPQAEPGTAPAEGDAEAIGRQLADLDEVLAAIETATQTLERSYAGEIDPGEHGTDAGADAEVPAPRSADEAPGELKKSE